jgi:hypothetical protein
VNKGIKRDRGPVEGPSPVGAKPRPTDKEVKLLALSLKATLTNGYRPVANLL